MHVHGGALSSITQYLENEGSLPLDAHEPRFQNLFRLVSPYRRLAPDERLLEIGVGTGGFLVLCARKGIRCSGLEISPQLLEHTQALARRYEVTLDLRLGNIEEIDIAPDSFDMIVADSVFEHVERWRTGLANVFRMLRPGGVLFFASTNKFALRSGEYPPLPFYGALPNPVRYWLRQRIHGADIMKLGIDFHQFSYPGLRRALREIGFTEVHDPAEFLDPDRLNHPTRLKVTLLRTMRWSRAAKHALLTFWPATELIAVK